MKYTILFFNNDFMICEINVFNCFGMDMQLLKIADES